MAAVEFSRVGSAMGWHISPENAQGLVDAFNAAARLGCDCTARAIPLGPDPDAPGLFLIGWEMSLTPRGEVTQSGGIGDYIVYESGTARLYRAADMASAFSAAVPLEWLATTQPPIAQALDNFGVSFTFPKPTSPNGPFAYAFVGRDNTAGGDPVSLPGTPAPDVSGNLVVEFSGLPDGHDCQFAVTVGTPYDGISATSLPSNSVTPVATVNASQEGSQVASEETAAGAAVSGPEGPAVRLRRSGESGR